jgi:hypothetical protein
METLGASLRQHNEASPKERLGRMNPVIAVQEEPEIDNLGTENRLNAPTRPSVDAGIMPVSCGAGMMLRADRLETIVSRS